jgi:hypothetical protein
MFVVQRVRARSTGDSNDERYSKQASSKNREVKIPSQKEVSAPRRPVLFLLASVSDWVRLLPSPSLLDVQRLTFYPRHP